MLDNSTRLVKKDQDVRFVVSGGGPVISYLLSMPLCALCWQSQSLILTLASDFLFLISLKIKV